MAIVRNALYNKLTLSSLLIAYAHSFGTLSNTNGCVIKVCHNKDCTKKGGGDALLQTFRDLMPAAPEAVGSSSNNDNNIVSVEKSGCLSQCGRGPNVCVLNSNKEEKMFFNVNDATTASAVLEVAAGEEYPIALLVAATMIVEADHVTSPSKKESLLSSAIDAITKETDAAILNSYAHAHSLFLRADARLEMIPPNVEGAIADARHAANIAPNERRAWRVLASAEEAGGDLTCAISALKELAKVDPSFAAKAKNEMERLIRMS